MSTKTQQTRTDQAEVSNTFRPQFSGTKLLTAERGHFTFDKWRARVMIFFTSPFAFNNRELLAKIILETRPSAAWKRMREEKCAMYISLDDQLLIVATDRISAFDYILPTGIPDKGKVLTQLSIFWFDFLRDVTPTHFITADVDALSRAAAGLSRRSWKAAPCWSTGRRWWRSSASRAAIWRASGWKEYRRAAHRVRHSSAGGAEGKRQAAGAHLHAGHQGANRA